MQTGQGQRAANLHKWQIALSDKCQSVWSAADSEPLTKLADNGLHSADNSRHLAKRHIDENILYSGSGQSCSSLTLLSRRDCRYAIHCSNNRACK